MGVVQRRDSLPKCNKNGDTWVASHEYLKFQQNKLKWPNLCNAFGHNVLSPGMYELNFFTISTFEPALSFTCLLTPPATNRQFGKVPIHFPLKTTPPTATPSAVPSPFHTC